MAAGQGFKTFTTGEVLTAGDVNGYLMQGINVFTNSTARDAAITAPAEGQFAFTKDNNSLWYYDGAAWVASGATGDIEGVTAGVGISGGGTSGTVTITNSMATEIAAKGDLIAGTGSQTFDNLTVGANDTVLTADSSTATGLKWAAPAAGGGMTLLSTTSLSGTSTTISSISGSYNDLVIVIRNLKASANDSVFFRFNGITAISNYYGFYTTGGNGTTGGAFKTSAPASLAWASSGKIIIENALSTTYPSSFEIIAQDYAKTTEPKSFSIQGANSNSGDNYVGNAQLIATTAAISSFTIGSNGGSATLSGSVLIYGVK